MHITKMVPELGAATAVAAAGFGQAITTALQSDVMNHLAGGELVYTFAEDGRVVGFAILNLWGDTIYLSGIIVEPGHQRRENLLEVMRLVKLEAPHAKYLALRTQSVLMWRAGSKLCGVWYPQAHADLQVPRHLACVGADVARRIGSKFQLHRGCYGSPLYGHQPVHRDLNLQAWWDGLCDFWAGDAVICVGELLPEFG